MLKPNPVTLIAADVVHDVKANVLRALDLPVGTGDARAIEDAVRNGVESTWEVGLAGDGIAVKRAFVYDVTAPTKDGLAGLIAGHLCERLELDGIVPATAPEVTYIHCIA